MQCTVWLKRSAFSLVPHRGMWGLSSGSPFVSAQKEPREAEGMAEVWQACLASGTEGGFLPLFPFPALLFLIWGGGGWNKSTELEFGGGVADDHVEQS